MNMHALMLAYTCAHVCIVAHMDLYIFVMADSHILKCTVHVHIADVNKPISGNNGTHTLTNIMTCTCILFHLTAVVACCTGH